MVSKLKVTTKRMKSTKFPRVFPSYLSDYERLQAIKMTIKTSLSTITSKRLNKAVGNAQEMEKLIFEYVLATRVPGIPFSRRRRDHAKRLFITLNDMSRIVYKYLRNEGVSRDEAFVLADNPRPELVPARFQASVMVVRQMIAVVCCAHFQLREEFEARSLFDKIAESIFWSERDEDGDVTSIAMQVYPETYELVDKINGKLLTHDDNFRKYILANWAPVRNLGIFETSHLETTSLEKKLVEHVATTALMKGGYDNITDIIKSRNIIKNAYWFWSGQAKDFAVDEATDMALSVALFAHCPDMPTAILLLLKQLNRMYNMQELMPIILTYCQAMANNLKDFIDGLIKEPVLQTPEQHARGASVQTTSDLFKTALDAAAIIEFFKKNGDSAAAIISLIGGIMFACVTVSLGHSAFKAEQAGSLFKKLGSLGMSMAGIKRGVSAFVDIIKGIDSIAKECVAWVVGRDAQFKLMSMIQTWDIPDSGEFVKANFLELVAYVIDPKNTFEIHNSAEKKHLLEKCDELVNAIIMKNVETPLGLSKESVSWLLYLRGEIKKVRTGVFRYPPAIAKRFVPYWINLYGDKGVGKSEIMTTLSNVISTVLYERGKYGFRSDPSQDIYAQNCSDKYMPAYNGQNIINIDDIFQDASSANTETSSALKMIAYVAGVPYSIVQASLDEKGMQFKSKIVITTTNVSLPQRKELADPGALLTRIRKMIHIRWKEGVCKNCRVTRGIEVCKKCAKLNDEWFKRPIEAVVLTLNEHCNAWIPGAVLTGKEMVRRIIKEFEHYHDLQEQLLERASTRDPLVDEILQETRVKTTSYFWSFSVWAIAGCYKYGVNDYLWRNTKLGFAALAEAFQLARLNNRLVNDYFEHVNYLNRILEPEGADLMIEMEYNNRRVKVIRLADITDEGLRNFCQQVNNAYLARMDEYPDVDFEMYLACVIEFYVHGLFENQDRACDALRRAWTAWSQSVLAAVFKTFALMFVVFVVTKFVLCLCTPYTSCSMHTTSAKYNVQPSRAKPVKVFVGRPNIVQTTSSEKVIYASQHDGNTLSLLQNVVLRSGVVCNMVLKKKDSELNTTCVRIKGPWILMNAHCRPIMENGDIMEIHIWSPTGTKIVKQVFDETYLRYFEAEETGETDAMLYMCDKSMPSARDITSHFLKDSVNFATTEAVVCQSYPMPHVVSNTFATPIVQQIGAYDGAHGGRYSMLSQYQVPMETVVGQSGSLLMANNVGFSRKILGIQTAKCGGLTYFQPITENMLRTAIGDEPIIEDIDECEFETTSKLKRAEEPHAMLGDNGLRYIGELPKEKTVIMSKRSKLRPSVIFDEDNVTQMPSVLADNDDRMDDELVGQSVVYRNLKGFDGQTGYVQRFVLSVAVMWLSAWYAVKQQVRGIPARLLNNYEMVNGSGTLLKQLDMRTSPGLPYIWERKKPNLRGKFEWFTETIEENGAKVYAMKDELEAKVILREEMAKQGKRVETLAYACLKDETRPIEKIKKGKTRVFLCMPMDYNMLVRKYFGTFTMMMHKRAGAFIAPCVGVDPCVGWTALVRRLRTVGNNFEDFDYTGWDTLIHPEFIEAVADVVNAWYDDGEENAMVRRTLMRELAHTMVVVKNKVFVKTSGQVSGCAITAESNSIVNELLMLYCWIVLSLQYEPELCSFEGFSENCQLGVYGDDIVKCVSDSAKWFNGNNIKTVVEETGMTLTTGDKTDNFRFIDIKDMSFLKRSFKDEGYGKFTAPLRKDIIDNITQWIHRCDTPCEATMVNVRTAARNYALWGRKDYEQFCGAVNKRISRAVRDGNVDLMPVTESYDRAMIEIQLMDLC